MKHASSIKLHSYWLSCRGAMGVRAGGIRAAELAPLLPTLFLFDLDQTSDLRLRFCGSEIARRFGRDLTDEGFLALWNADDRRLLRGHLRTLATNSLGLVAGVLGETLGGGFTSLEMLILPLTGEAAPAGAIGCMARIGGHEESNRIRARLTAQSLRSVRFLPTPTTVSDLNDADVLGQLPPPPSTFRRRYRHLSVVPGGLSPPE